MIKKGFLVFIALTFFYLLFKIKTRDDKVELNIANSKKVKISMTPSEVLKIMGKPDYSDTLDYKGLKVYSYLPPYGASEGIDIYFDSTNLVNRIILLEK